MSSAKPLTVDTLQLLNHPIISERYFFPRPGQPPEPRDFKGVDGARLRCYHASPHRGAKTLVHFHGNGEIVADYLHDYVPALLNLGVNVLMVEYRGYGGSEGETRLGEMLGDVTAVREQCGLEPKDTLVYGRSVGGIFAVEWAFQDPSIAGLILESAVADPRERLLLRLSPAELGVDQVTFDRACDTHLNHQKKLSVYGGPLLLLHADQDDLVRPAHARAHYEWSPSSDKELVLFPRGDHNSILGANWNPYLVHLGKFFGS